MTAGIGDDDHRTQRERMLAGDLYIADDPELAAESLRARLLLDQFNRAPADAAGERRRVLDRLLGGFAAGSEIRPPFYCDYGYPIRIGARTFVNFGLVALDVAPIVIGDDVQIGPNVQLLTPTHPLEAEARRAKWEAAEPITIGSNVWLGRRGDRPGRRDDRGEHRRRRGRRGHPGPPGQRGGSRRPRSRHPNAVTRPPTVTTHYRAAGLRVTMILRTMSRRFCLYCLVLFIEQMYDGGVLEDLTKAIEELELPADADALAAAFALRSRLRPAQPPGRGAGPGRRSLSHRAGLRPRRGHLDDGLAA